MVPVLSISSWNGATLHGWPVTEKIAVQAEDHTVRLTDKKWGQLLGFTQLSD